MDNKAEKFKLLFVSCIDGFAKKHSLPPEEMDKLFSWALQERTHYFNKKEKTDENLLEQE